MAGRRADRRRPRVAHLLASLIVRPATPPVAITACAHEHWLGAPHTLVLTAIALRLADPHALGLFSAPVRDALRLGPLDSGALSLVEDHGRLTVTAP